MVKWEDDLSPECDCQCPTCIDPPSSKFMLGWAIGLAGAVIGMVWVFGALG
jgi:hypothetical protein